MRRPLVAREAHSVGDDRTRGVGRPPRRAGRPWTRAEFLKQAWLAACALAFGAGRRESHAVAAVERSSAPSNVTMARIPAGRFVMGDAGGSIDELPHTVYVDAFDIDTHPVTQAHYRQIMGHNISRWEGGQNPVEQVRWSDAARYGNARSAAEGLPPCYDLTTWACDFAAPGYRLPTEAEWEYACRAGTRSRYFFGDESDKLGAFAWFEDNSGGRPRPVGQKLPNPWGLHDIYGNVWEWCHDFYGVDYYKLSPENNPTGPETGDTRVLRGGCWNSTAQQCRSGYRYNEDPGYSDICFGYDIYGFRCVRRRVDPLPGK